MEHVMMFCTVYFIMSFIICANKFDNMLLFLGCCFFETFLQFILLSDKIMFRYINFTFFYIYIALLSKFGCTLLFIKYYEIRMYHDWLQSPLLN